MPKTYSQDKKEKWLEELSGGKSTKQIARESNADERTVKQAIKDIKSKAAAQQALTQMYQEALRNHMNVLNSAIIEILKELELPSPFMPYFDWHNVKSQEALLQFEQENKSKETKTANVEADPFSDRALLAEHLKNSKAWRALIEWQRSLKKHRLACGRLQIQTLKIISEKCDMEEYRPEVKSFRTVTLRRKYR